MAGVPVTSHSLAHSTIEFYTGLVKSSLKLQGRLTEDNVARAIMILATSHMLVIEGNVDEGQVSIRWQGVAHGLVLLPFFEVLLAVRFHVVAVAEVFDDLALTVGFLHSFGSVFSHRDGDV